MQVKTIVIERGELLADVFVVVQPPSGSSNGGARRGATETRRARFALEGGDVK